MEANKNLFNDPEILFQTFAKRLYSGTIGGMELIPLVSIGYLLQQKYR